jgi:hypothetical protein
MSIEVPTQTLHLIQSISIFRLWKKIWNLDFSGCFSCEVCFLLFSYKINYSNTFFMIRGNHECRVLTDFFNFKAECTWLKNKYFSYGLKQKQLFIFITLTKSTDGFNSTQMNKHQQVCTSMGRKFIKCFVQLLTVCQSLQRSTQNSVNFSVCTEVYHLLSIRYKSCSFCYFEACRINCTLEVSKILKIFVMLLYRSTI